VDVVVIGRFRDEDATVEGDSDDDVPGRLVRMTNASMARRRRCVNPRARARVRATRHAVVVVVVTRVVLNARRVPRATVCGE
jgi:hypothetical protein